MIATVHRKAHFNAAHRLFRKEWSYEQNDKVFGKCANPHFHGHNYELIVSVTGEVSQETGFVTDLAWLSDIIKAEVEDYLDHKNLNEQVAEFKNLNPTAENIAILIWKRLRPHINSDRSLEITLYETPRNFVTYKGE